MTEFIPFDPKDASPTVMAPKGMSPINTLAAIVEMVSDQRFNRDILCNAISQSTGLQFPNRTVCVKFVGHNEINIDFSEFPRLIIHNSALKGMLRAYPLFLISVLRKYHIRNGAEKADPSDQITMKQLVGCYLEKI